MEAMRPWIAKNETVKSYLLVHTVSYGYVKNIADYIFLQIQKDSPGSAEFHLCESIDNVHLEADSIVYIIGDPFKPFSRVDGCKYVFLNFSVLCLVGNPLACSLSGYRLIKRKRRILEGKLQCYDYILDFWPAHTAVLKGEVPTPVQSFPVAMTLDKSSKAGDLSSRQFDVCIVGSGSRRRNRIIAKLRKLGLRLSPEEGVVLEEVARDSKIVLNLHLQRCNHLEYPRILSAFMSKSALVSEYSFGMEQYFPGNTYVSSNYGGLIHAVQHLLADPGRLQQMVDNAYAWVSDIYLERCNAEWKNLLAEIHKHFQL